MYKIEMGWANWTAWRHLCHASRSMACAFDRNRTVTSKNANRKPRNNFMGSQWKKIPERGGKNRNLFIASITLAGDDISSSIHSPNRGHGCKEKAGMGLHRMLTTSPMKPVVSQPGVSPRPHCGPQVNFEGSETRCGGGPPRHQPNRNSPSAVGRIEGTQSMHSSENGSCGAAHSSGNSNSIQCTRGTIQNMNTT